MSENDPTPDSPPADDANPLQHIIDDTETRGDAQEWIYRQFVEGRDADSLLAELIENGWNPDVAEEMVEEGRRSTRHLRGIVTREDVARVADRRYRKWMRFAFRVTILVTVLLILLVILPRC